MAGRFSQSILDQIRAANDIVDVVGSYIPLKRAGANFRALCPFHKEKTPSFNVNPHLQIFHCFGCGKGGNVFSFVQQYESLEFPEAVKRLAERARITLEYENTPADQQTRHIKDTLLQIHEQITQRWQAALANDAAGQIARDYLAKRGVAPEAIQLFRLGYAPEAWDDTVNWGRSKDYEPALMEKAGLILHKEDSDRYYDRFRGRLMFPICDEQGRVIGFSGRILAGDEKSAKYVNSPETPIFIKSKVFFGLDKSKRALLDAGYAIVCEGQLDLIACYMAGIQNIVAPQGTAFTGDHARILKRYVEEVVLCFDSDTAGQNAAVRSLDHLLASELAVRVAVMPASHDPDSFIKASGGPAFKALIEGAQGFFDYYLDRLCATEPTSTDKGRLAVLRSMSEAVHKTGNIVLIDKYAQKTALRLGVSPEAVRAEFKKTRSPRPAAPAQEEPTEPVQIPVVPPTRDEFGLVQLLFQNEDFAGWVAEHLQPGWLPHPLVRRIIVERIRTFQDGSWKDLPAFLELLADAESQSLLTEAVTSNYMEGAGGVGPVQGHRDHLRGRALPNPLQDLKGFATRLRNAHLDSELARLNRDMATLEPGSPQQVELLHQLSALKAAKKQPIEPPTPSV